ncbi:hypothetical protein BAOM_2776 [Peribacillus asahii]|uniref:Uncharacterized protein n=1 Tax=Peribacillus asahii TaxID=228899 RepID=A0A3T0KT10_9BACI|nr:hypothetical protein BAOM_2776 [Peribacillus asahii]
MSKNHKNYQIFYKKMLQLNIEKACFDQFFFKIRFFYLLFYKVALYGEYFSFFLPCKNEVFFH